MTDGHRDAADLGAYALGGLTAAEEADIDEHVTGCPTCRHELAELRDIADRLGEVPPELFLDGPPEGGDLLVRRAVGRVTAERRGAVSRRRLLTAAAAVAVGALVLGAGVLTGRQTAPAPAPVAAAPVAGTRTVQATDAGTGAAITAQVIPAAGWVRVSAEVTGIPAGQRCRVVVVGADGQRQVAGSWLVSEKAAAEGSNLQGFALVDPAQVTAVVVENLDGRQFVSAPVP
jgi:anti-sigma factor RsiW